MIDIHSTTILHNIIVDITGEIGNPDPSLTIKVSQSACAGRVLDNIHRMQETSEYDFANV